MVKKHIITILLIFFANAFFCKANSFEDEEKKDIGLQVGIDATMGLYLLSNVFSDDNVNLDPNYYFFVKYKFLRLQAGAYFSNNSFQNTNNSKNSTNNIRLKFGIEKKFEVSKNINFFAGSSFIYSYYKLTFNENFNLQYGYDSISNFDIEHSFGPGIYAGIEWFLTTKLSLSTDATFDFVFERNKEKSFSSSFPESLGREEITPNYQSQYGLPLSNLLLRFKF